jgi:hypothetical protein
MSKALQWIIGIGVVLVVMALVFSFVAPFIFARFGYAAMGANPQFGDGRAFGNWGPGHMFGGRGMMGGFRGFGLPFMGFGMLLGPLALIGLVVLIVALLTRRNPAPVAAAAVAPAPAPAAPAAPVSATTPCAHCGQPLEAGWKACPYCGEKI